MFGVSHVPELIFLLYFLLIIGGFVFLITRAFRSRAGGTTLSQPPDRYDQLRKLSDLRRDGILSEQEYQQEKAKLLAQDTGSNRPTQESP